MKEAPIKGAEAFCFFTTDTEIIALNADGVIQGAACAVGGVEQPGISPPVGRSMIRSLAGPYYPDDSSWGLVTRIIKEGCYIRLDEHSGFPFIYLRDFSWDKWWGRTDDGHEASMADPRHDGRQQKITKRWTRIEGFSNPLLIPPTARYIQGCGSNMARYSIGGYDAVDDDHFRGVTWQVKVVVRTLDNPPLAENDKWPTEYFLTFYNPLYTGVNGGLNQSVLLPAMPIILSGNANASSALCGNMGVNGPTPLTNIVVSLHALTYDCETLKNQVDLTVTGVELNDVDLEKDQLTAIWFVLGAFANWEDPVQGNMPELTDIEVTM